VKTVLFYYPKRKGDKTMNALKATEVIQFPREIQVVNWVNSRNEIMKRETRAKIYSRKCKAKAKHEDFWCILSGFSVCVAIIALYFIGIVL
jgi:hypothetical protein